MASSELVSVPGYHNVKNVEARELLQPYLQTDGYYLLRPSADSKGGVLCTICVTNRSKLVNYRLVRDKSGNYCIFGNTTFPSIESLLSHYNGVPINAEVNTRLLNPVLTEEQQRQLAKSTSADDTYVVMERGSEDVPANQTNQNNMMSTIPGLHLYLPKSEINTVMSKYLHADGHYLVRPSASSEGQLTLAVSNGGKVLNFKIVDSGGLEYYISPRRKFPSVQALLETYKTTPIKGKKNANAKVYLLHPIPVDTGLEKKHIKLLEKKASRKTLSPTPGSAPSPPDELPAPWQCHMHEQYKKPYYFNPETEESTWERPRAPKPKPAPPSVRENGHGLPPRKMRDRPLPSPPGKTTPTHQAAPGSSPRRTRSTNSAESAPPPLPDRTELRPQNGPVRGMTMPSGQRSPRTMPRGERPQLPPKQGETTPTPDNPPLPLKEPGHHHHRSSVGSRPQMPIPGGNAPSLPDRARPAPPVDHAPSLPDRGRAVPPRDHTPSLPDRPRAASPADHTPSQPERHRAAPPLPPKEDTPPARAPPTRHAPPLPPKEDEVEDMPPPAVPPLPEKQTNGSAAGRKKERKRIVEYEDTVLPFDHAPKPAATPTSRPPLPEKDVPAVVVSNGPAPPPPPPPPLAAPIPPPPPVPAVDISPPSSNNIPPPPPPLTPGGTPAPPPPPPLLPPPPSPAPTRSSRTESAPPPPQADTGSGRPFCANDLLAARTLLKNRTDAAAEEPKKATGVAGVFANAIDTRMMSIRRAVVDSGSEESEFEDVDDDEWDD